MNLVTVDSSMVHAAGYDPESRHLEIVFTSGDIYRYQDVPSEVCPALLAAESKGKYLRSHVLGIFPYVRLSRPRGGLRGATRTGTPCHRSEGGRRH